MNLFPFSRRVLAGGWFLLLVGFLGPILPARAQAVRVETPGESAKLLENVRAQIVAGRAQLERNQTSSVDTLRAAAQQSLKALVSYMGTGVLTAAPEQMPSTGFLAAAARQTAEAHYWWGRAADQFGRRDEAITALARAARFAGRVRPNAIDTLARDSLLALGAALRDGLPDVAPDDTLTTIAEIAHGNLWQPRRFTFTTDTSIFEPRAGSAPPAKTEHEFLITSGRVYPPVPAGATNVASALSRVPPLYRDVPPEALPAVLRLDRMVVGYEKQTDGADKGLWRKAARMFYASTFLTHQQRDDRARAETMVAQFLRVHALFQSALGLQNPYSASDVTTLWLPEVSALWPRDDNDPRVREALGFIMPRVNTPTSSRAGSRRESIEIAVSPTSYPWRGGEAAGDFAPGDVVLFTPSTARPESEWLLEIMHEYGHVALPPIDNFAPPLEPYANGALGQTLGVLWAADAPQSWQPETTFGEQDAVAAGELAAQAENQALVSLQLWQARGPSSALRRDESAFGLQYLQGLTVFIERTYGAGVLGAAFGSLVEKSQAALKSQAADPRLINTSTSPKIAAFSTDSLVATFAAALRDPFSETGVAPSGVLPVWLPGALEIPQRAPSDFIARANLKLKAGERVSGWFFVPPSAGVLHLEWKSAAPDALSFDAAAKPASARVVSGAGHAADLDVKNRNGWQRLSFAAKGDVEIVAAQFEK